MSERTPQQDPATDARRKAARRLALILGGVTLAIYVGFILSGVLGK